MSATEQTPFVTLAEREFIAGSASGSTGKIVLSSFKFVAGKEFDDASDEIKAVLNAPPALLVQASMPFAVIPIKPSEIASADALVALSQKNSGIDAADLRLALVSGSPAPVAVCVSKAAVAARMQQASVLGAQSVRLFCRGVDTVAALRESLSTGKIDKPVLYIDILTTSARILVVSKDGVSDLGSVDTGTDAILEQVMAALGLKFPGSAAKLFYGDLYDFDEHAPKLISVLAEKVKGRLAGGLGGAPAPAYLYASGLPSSRTSLLSGKVAESLGLAVASLQIPLEAPDAPSYLQGASFGTAEMISARAGDPWMVNLAEPAADPAALFASLSKAAPAPAPAKPAPAPAPKPAAPAPAPKPAAPAPAAKPAPAPAPAKQAPAPAKPAPAPAPKPAAPAPAAKPAPAKPAPAPAPAKPAAPKTDAPAGKGSNKTVLYAGIGGAVLVVVVLAFVLFSGKKKETPAPAPVPAAVQTAKAPESAAPAKPAEPAKTPAPEPAKAPEPVATAPAPEPAKAPEPAPVVETAPAPATTGNISVQTSPVEADVLVDGQVQGVTPVMLYDIPVGTYTVEIRKQGFKVVTRSVDVEGGKTASLDNIVLEIDTGAVKIASSPDGVTYVITPTSEGAGVDDASVLKGKTPAEVSGLRPGSYSISFRREGWKDYTRTFEIQSGDTTSSAFEYKGAKVVIATTPDGATVTADGRELGKTPLELDDTAEGVMNLSVNLDGYEPEKSTLDVPFGGNVSRSFKLLRLDRVITRATDLDSLPSHEGGAVVRVPADLIAGFSGKVYVRVVIDQGGKVQDAEVVSGSGLRDTAAAYVANIVHGWTFTPGMRKGFPMRVEVVIPVEIAQ